MRFAVLFIGLLSTVCGCASLQEAYHLDREFGDATRVSWAQQVVRPGHQSAIVPEGLEGITAEQVMDVYNGTFAEKPQQMQVFSFSTPGGK